MHLSERYDRSVAAAQANWNLGFSRPAPLLLLPSHTIAFVAKPTALFAVGDVLVSRFLGGLNTRHYFAGFSTKKGCAIPHARKRSPWENQLVRVGFCRWPIMACARAYPGYPDWDRAAQHDYFARDNLPSQRFTNFVPVQLLEFPRELERRPLADAAVRSFAVEALRAAYAAFRVGTGSPELSAGS